MTRLRPVVCLAAVFVLAAGQVFAQQPLRNSAMKAGAAIAAAGGTAIVLGATALKTGDSTSGNLPKGMYDTCVALKANPVYQNNDCGVLKGPNTAVMIGGTVAAALGVTLMMFGSSRSSVQISASRVFVRYHVSGIR